MLMPDAHALATAVAGSIAEQSGSRTFAENENVF
jgi:hypothetical protein